MLFDVDPSCDIVKLLSCFIIVHHFCFDKSNMQIGYVRSTYCQADGQFLWVVCVTCSGNIIPRSLFSGKHSISSPLTARHYSQWEHNFTISLFCRHVNSLNLNCDFVSRYVHNLWTEPRIQR